MRVGPENDRGFLQGETPDETERWAIWICPAHPDEPVGTRLDEECDCSLCIPADRPPMRRIEVVPVERYEGDPISRSAALARLPHEPESQIKIARVGGVPPSGYLDVQLHGGSTIPQPESVWVPAPRAEAAEAKLGEMEANYVADTAQLKEWEARYQGANKHYKEANQRAEELQTQANRRVEAERKRADEITQANQRAERAFQDSLAIGQQRDKAMDRAADAKARLATLRELPDEWEQEAETGQLPEPAFWAYMDCADALRAALSTDTATCPGCGGYVDEGEPCRCPDTTGDED